MGELGYYEFFAGGGMARAGLGSRWRCLFANDFDPMKARVYQDNFGGEDLVCRDVAKIQPCEIAPGGDLAWASFPCQDLSLAGDYKGLGPSQGGETLRRSGSFWSFWRLIESLGEIGRGPSLVVLENVLGVLTSNQGEDFVAIAAALSKSGYRFGAMVIDARHFLPQSRPRVFIIAIRKDIPLPSHLASKAPSPPWISTMIKAAYGRLSPHLAEAWVWWRLPGPPERTEGFSALVEDEPSGVSWSSEAETAALLASMSPLNRAKVEAASLQGRRVVGTLYKRTRPDRDGRRTVRTEVRFDDIAGCLRTPSGGSSRQRLLIVEGDQVRARLLSAREAARLMGLPDSYKLPVRYNEAYKVAGDGVVVPVVAHLAKHLLEPLAARTASQPGLAAE